MVSNCDYCVNYDANNFDPNLYETVNMNDVQPNCKYLWSYNGSLPECVKIVLNNRTSLLVEKNKRVMELSKNHNRQFVFYKKRDFYGERSNVLNLVEGLQLPEGKSPDQAVNYMLGHPNMLKELSSYGGKPRKTKRNKKIKRNKKNKSKNNKKYRKKNR